MRRLDTTWKSWKTMLDHAIPDTRFVCIIGAQRSGSTWLHHMLDSHPDIHMARPVRPEPKFFMKEPVGEDARERYLQQYFSTARAGMVLGEKSASYIETPQAAARILSFFPKAKAIATLRHPVIRAISNYHFTAEHGLEPRTLREVFLDELPAPPFTQEISVNPFTYLERSDYLSHLEPWMDAFGDDLQVVVLEELMQEPALLQELYAWIGVERAFMPAELNAPLNMSEVEEHGKNDAEVIRKLSQYCAPLIEALEDRLGRKIPSWHDPL